MATILFLHGCRDFGTTAVVVDGESAYRTNLLDGAQLARVLRVFQPVHVVTNMSTFADKLQGVIVLEDVGDVRDGDATVLMRAVIGPYPTRELPLGFFGGEEEWTAWLESPDDGR